MAQKRFWNVERVLELVFLLLAGGMWYGARDFVRDAQRFPRLVSSIVFVLAAYLLIGQMVHWVRGRGQYAADEKVAAVAQPSAEATHRPFLPWWDTLAMTVAFIVVVMAFSLGTGILMFTTVASRRIGLSWPKAALYGVLFSGFIWWIFGIVLRIPMPEGAIITLF